VVVVDTGNYYPRQRDGRIEWIEAGATIAGDEESAKAVVIRLLDELGFDAVDAGGPDESWRQQPGSPVCATDFNVAGVKPVLSEATKERKSGALLQTGPAVLPSLLNRPLGTYTALLKPAKRTFAGV
jgi:hypothetical protein